MKASVSTGQSSWWFSSIQSKDEFFIMPNNEYVEGSWFVVEKNDKIINFSFSENTTSADRDILIVIQAGNYFDYLTVVQTKK